MVQVAITLQAASCGELIGCALGYAAAFCSDLNDGNTNAVQRLTMCTSDCL